MKTRPCWVVLVPKRATYRNLHERWEVVRGKAAHDAIIDFEPGSECSGDEALAQAASRTSKQPAYVLWCDEESPRVQVFANGKYVGEISAWPDRVARQLACSFPTIAGGRGPVDLTPHKAPTAKQGEATIGRWTVRQWQHMIAHDADWSILLDGAGEAVAEQVLVYLDDNKPDLRALACRLLRAIGYVGDCEFGLGTLARATLERVRQLAANDPDADVRAAANDTAGDLAERLETYAIRAEFPWINNFDASALGKALDALDDARVAVRSHVVAWWMGAWHVPSPIGKKVETKLVALLATAKRDARPGLELALDNVRRKMRAPARR